MLVQVHQCSILELENDKDVLCDVDLSFSTLELENLQKIYTHIYDLQVQNPSL
jgi:hypothetical protein